MPFNAYLHIGLSHKWKFKLAEIFRSIFQNVSNRSIEVAETCSHLHSGDRNFPANPRIQGTRNGILLEKTSVGFYPGPIWSSYATL